jgi:hypothetical protein
MTKRSNSRVWTADDTERLKEHIAAGGSAPRAAIKFKRTEAAVRAQAAELGLRFPTIRELRKKAFGEAAE